MRSIRRIAAAVLAASCSCASLSAAAQAMGGMGPGGMNPTGPGGMWDDLLYDRSDESVGMTIYRKGILPGDRELTATRAGSSVARGQVACANCHQRSGLGAREGQQTIPPVTGAALYAPRAGRRAAYTDETLAAAIVSGVDPNGRELSALMPRYPLQAGELAQLIDYLKKLAPRPSLGVVDSVIHLATVVTEGVAPARKQAMLEVMQKYLDDLNGGSAASRAGRPAGVGEASTGERPMRWQLHVWTLDGTAQDRRAQLQAYYARQPVFALVGGLSTDTWLPVHQFCLQFRVPCLFPNTSVPVTGAAAFYSLYFDKGSVLKGQILGRYFADHVKEFSGGRIVQVLPGDWTGYEPASALRQAIGGRMAAARRVTDEVIQAGARISVDRWRQLLNRSAVSALVVWMEEPDLSGLAELSNERELPAIFVADNSFAGKAPVSEPRLRGKLRFISTLNPVAQSPAMASWDEWMRAHRLAPSEALLQANSWFVMSLIDEAVRANGGDTTPEHLIERIEYSAGAVVAHPMLPSLSLGMGQRFATKGGYILALRLDGPGLVPVTDLIVP